MFRMVTLSLLICTVVNSDVITVSGNRGKDIQIALNMASCGDTVHIPQGDYFFDRSVVVEKRVSVIGSGKEKTKIYRKNNVAGLLWLFRINGNKSDHVRISGMALLGDLSEVTSGILLENESENFRVDNCTFKHLSRRAVKVKDGGKGVIDNNIFIDNWPTAVVVYGRGEKEWERGLSLGSENAVFVEDNYFEQGDVPNKSMAHHVASNNGSKYVFRYNVINDQKMASHAVDAHGNKFYWPRGSRSYEIYGNRINAVHRWAGINIRGGDGVIFNNRFFGSFVSPIHLMHECREGDGECEYPCIDQIRELYMWDNWYNEKRVDVYVRHKHLIRQGRDYLLYEHPEYRPFEYPHPLTRQKK